jgi:hypothetical protein
MSMSAPSDFETYAWGEIVETLQLIEPVLHGWRDIVNAAPGSPEQERAIEAMGTAWAHLAASYDTLRDIHHILKDA